MRLRIGVGVLCVLLLAVGILIGIEIGGKDVQAASGDGRYVLEMGQTGGYWVVSDTSTGTSNGHFAGTTASKTKPFVKGE
jgi:hypothetical protein